MILESDAFADGGEIPRRCTCDGAGASPPLAWRDVPEGTDALVLTVSDPDAPAGTWTHWVLFNVPTTVSELSEGASGDGALPTGALEGRNSWGRTAYGGPCPPRGTTHRYFFKLYAVDTALDLPPSASAAMVTTAAERHAVADCVLMGRYRRG